MNLTAPIVAGSRSGSEVSVNSLFEVKNVDGLKEAMIAHIYERSLNCFENGYLCASNGQCCSGMCIWYEQGGHLCQSGCLPNGTNGCTFNNDCCSNYCEWKWGTGNNLCH